mmetsp:Transcript_13617/g.16366  ORF Transcript_13617/g.16366 Transcript_13617/m.16366 type:complete len:632 (+) Transcript_13617:154-2049(+)|eukprot:CAMPEP_0197860052 /NCGR_PEP_ID=MMETSP1438-20131217/35152_1 /TAXON_ID=1461541 /ORGANISM="Pterosperma sp., Strain CCMP1384" /LENGTH=631 /DNA_ID=CAMNT_0043476773 /DNA_START=150 /DNA_END=2045 /DNA_ORIENTATION=+
MPPKDKPKVEVSAEEAQKVMEDMDLSPEELDRFTTCFKDPKFMEMFVDYAKEISDPAQREEHDMYLRQLETEGKIEEIYGKGAVMIQPEKGFLVKTKKIKGEGSEKGEKVFINICHSDRVDEAHSVKAKGGETWNIPYSLSTLRKEKDNKGEDVDTHDFVVNTKFYDKTKKAQTDMFRNFLIETAIENIEKMRYEGKVAMDRKNYALPKSIFKGPEKVPVQATKCSKDPEAIKNAMGTKPKRMEPKGNPDAKDYPGMKQENVTPNQGSQSSGKSSAFKFEKKKQPPKEVGLVEPKYEIVHCKKGDIQQAWSDNKLQSDARRPDSLLVRISLPRLDKMSGVDLDVSKNRVLLTKPEMYRLDLSLPYEVDDSKGRAKFDKGRRALEVTLPVVPAPVPLAPSETEPAKPLITPIDPPSSSRSDAGDEKDQASKSATPEATQESAGEDEPDIEPWDEPQSAGGGGGQAEEGEEEAASDGPSDNERKWKEMMALHDEKHNVEEAANQIREKQSRADAAAEAAAAAASMPGTLEGDFWAVSTFQGPRLGYVFKLGDEGLGYYKDQAESAKFAELIASAKAPKETPANKAVVSKAEAEEGSKTHTTKETRAPDPVEAEPIGVATLQPRLVSDFMNELD